MNRKQKLEQELAILKAKLGGLERERSRLWNIAWGLDFAIRLLSRPMQGD